MINGKRVLAPHDDIAEVKNAYGAYEYMQKLDMYSVEDLLLAHRLMTEGIIKESGRFRSGNAGVYDQDHNLMHAGTPANYVPELVRELFEWMRGSNMHPLVKSCVFHYEFEFIHPFADGNGRTGRLWHTLILMNWKSFFAWLPIETLIHENQNEYYSAINASNNSGESTIFVEFMLRIIKKALEEIVENQDAHRHVGDYVGINVGNNVGINMRPVSTEDKMLELLKRQPEMTAAGAAAFLGVSVRQAERVIAALKADGKLVRIGANRGGRWKVVE